MPANQTELDERTTSLLDKYCDKAAHHRNHQHKRFVSSDAVQNALADDVADYSQKNPATPNGKPYQGMDISKVPAALATKSSRATMKTMRKESSR